MGESSEEASKRMDEDLERRMDEHIRHMTLQAIDSIHEMLSKHGALLGAIQALLVAKGIVTEAEMNDLARTAKMLGTHNFDQSQGNAFDMAVKQILNRFGEGLKRVLHVDVTGMTEGQLGDMIDNLRKRNKTEDSSGGV